MQPEPEFSSGLDTPDEIGGRQAGSPFVMLTRAQWAQLREQEPMSLSAQEIRRLAGLGDPIDLTEVEAVYLPLSRLLNMYVTGTDTLHQITSNFLGERSRRTPFIVGVAGSVAVGKSTTARLLRELLSRWEGTPVVDLVTTDGFLYSNAELERRNLMERKGFPESYDRRLLLQFLVDVKSGKDCVYAPRYDHLTYDILPGEYTEVRRPDVLILEGLNVLQPPRLSESSPFAPSDFFDFSIYVDAKASDVRDWFVTRFLTLRRTAFANEASFFHQFAMMPDAKAVQMAAAVWDQINEPNLRENIEPTRGRANLVLRKAYDHQIDQILLRKL